MYRVTVDTGGVFPDSLSQRRTQVQESKLIADRKELFLLIGDER